MMGLAGDLGSSGPFIHHHHHHNNNCIIYQSKKEESVLRGGGPQRRGRATSFGGGGGGAASLSELSARLIRRGQALSGAGANGEGKPGREEVDLQASVAALFGSV